MNQPLPRSVTGQVIGFTAAEFLRMGELGAFDDVTVELIEGEIHRVNPPMGAHGSRQAQIVGLLWAATGGVLGLVHGEVAIRFGDDTVAGCDAAVLRRPVTEHRTLDPEEVLLLVEVAGTTAERDLVLRRALYAAAGVPAYWVVDGKKGLTRVFAGPVDGAYPGAAQVPFGQPLAVPGTDATVTP